MPELIRELFRNDIVTPLVRSRYRDVDWRRRSKIQNLRHDVRGLEEELRAGKPLWQFFAKGIDVSARRFAALLFQLQQNFRVGSPQGSGIAIAEIDAAVGNADVIDKGLPFFVRD